MTNSQLKKQEIEKKIQAIEQRLNNKFQATKETIELGRSPQKLVSKRPLGSLLITFGLGLIVGKVARAASTRKRFTSDTHHNSLQNHSNYSNQFKERSGLVSNEVKLSVKKRITQKIINGLLDYAEESLNDYLRRSNSKKGTESNK